MENIKNNKLGENDSEQGETLIKDVDSGNEDYIDLVELFKAFADSNTKNTSAVSTQQQKIETVQGKVVKETADKNTALAENESTQETMQGRGQEEEPVQIQETEEQPTDILFMDAIQTVLEAGQASTSLLQRKLRVGYARAGRLIEEMEKRGIVSKHKGAKPRDVLIGVEDFNQLKMRQKSEITDEILVSQKEQVAEVITNERPTNEIIVEAGNATATVTEPIHEAAQAPEQIQDEQQAEKYEFLEILSDENTASAVNEPIRKNVQVQEPLQQEETATTEIVQEEPEQETEPILSEEESLEYLDAYFLELQSSEIKEILLGLSKEKLKDVYSKYSFGLSSEDKKEVKERIEEPENEGKSKSDKEQETEPTLREEESLEYLEAYFLELEPSEIKEILLSLSKEKLKDAYSKYSFGLSPEDKKEVEGKIRNLEIEEIKAKRKKFMWLTALLPKWVQKDRE